MIKSLLYFVAAGLCEITPDKFDLIGGAVALAGVFIIMYWPRNA